MLKNPADCRSEGTCGRGSREGLLAKPTIRPSSWTASRIFDKKPPSGCVALWFLWLRSRGNEKTPELVVLIFNPDVTPSSRPQTRPRAVLLQASRSRRRRSSRRVQLGTCPSDGLVCGSYGSY